MDAQTIWQNKHIQYSKSEFIKTPTLFSQEVLKYFLKNSRLLDLGCGQGQDSIFFASQGLQVTGADFSSSALEFASQNSKDLNPSPKYLQHDLRDKFPFPNWEFDIVYSHLSLHFFDDTTTNFIFSEIARVLESGGIFAALFNTLNDPEVSKSKKLPSGLYLTPSGLEKRFFTPDSLKSFTTKYFDTIILDEKGITYKDGIDCLVRFVGRKI